MKNILKILNLGIISGFLFSFGLFAQAFSDSPYITTESASSITKNSAVLRAIVNPNGLQTYVWFEYGESPYVAFAFGDVLYTTPQSMGVGSENLSFYESISGLKSYTDYYYRAVAANSAGTSYGKVLMFVTAPYSSLNPVYASPFVTTKSPVLITENSAILKGQVNPNGQETYAWFEYGTSIYFLSAATSKQFVGNGATLEFGHTLANLLPGTTYYYRVMAENSTGKSYGEILSFATLFTSLKNPAVETEKASDISISSALIKGKVNPRGNFTNAWFEWGPTKLLGSLTAPQPIGKIDNFSDCSYALTGLSANTNFYYRAAAENSYGKSYGDILNFTTQKTLIAETPSKPQAIVQKIIEKSPEEKSGPEKISMVLLFSATNKEKIKPGQEFDYLLSLTNSDSQIISDAVLRVNFPSEIKFLSANPEPNKKEESNLIFNLDRVEANQQKLIIAKMKANEGIEEGNLIFNSFLNYKDAQGNPQSANTSLTLSVEKEKELVASLLEAIKNLAGKKWIYLILLSGIIIIFYLVKRK